MWNLIGANKACAELELQREHYLHQRKLFTAKPVVDSRPPRQHSHLSAKTSKKHQQHQERMETIQKDNELLLGKMLQIDVRPMTTGRPDPRATPSLHRYQHISRSRKISAFSPPQDAQQVQCADVGRRPQPPLVLRSADIGREKWTEAGLPWQLQYEVGPTQYSKDLPCESEVCEDEEGRI